MTPMTPTTLHGERLYVGNLPSGVTRQKLRDLFGMHGDVAGVTVFREAQPSAPTACAYVQMRTVAEALACATSLDGVDFEGHALRVVAHSGTHTGATSAAATDERLRPARSALFVNSPTEAVHGSRLFRPPPTPARKGPRARS